MKMLLNRKLSNWLKNSQNSIRIKFKNWTKNIKILLKKSKMKIILLNNRPISMRNYFRNFRLNFLKLKNLLNNKLNNKDNNLIKILNKVNLITKT